MDENVIVKFVNILAQVLSIALLARVILSWVSLSPTNPLVVIVHQITEPILAPIRRVLPRMGTLDLSPMIGLILVYAIKNIILRIL